MKKLGDFYSKYFAMKPRRNVGIMFYEVFFMIYSQAYGIYQQSRNASWQFLLDNKIDRLPVKLSSICRENNYILCKDSKIHYLKPLQLGATFYANSTWYIVFSDRISVQAQRYTIAHELGHIFLGHSLVDGKYGRTFATSPEEYQAERFAIDILAPACVLWGLNLHSAEDIARVCNISMTSATKRARRMEELYRRNMFLSQPLERQVYQQFRRFISENR